MEMLENFMCGFLGGIVGGIFLIVAVATIGGVNSKEKSSPPSDKVIPPGPAIVPGGPYCPDCHRECKVLHSHKGHRVYVCPKCGPVNLVVVGREVK